MGVTAAVVLTTVGTKAQGAALARRLVERGVAACVQMLPIESVYRWKGAVAEESETLLLVKLAAERYPEVEAEILSAHPYETPEILMLPVTAGLPAYLAWLGEAPDGGS